jgi:AbrB family looped-hinge helix DNA binding protein
MKNPVYIKTLNNHGQMTIPSELREKMDLKAHDKVEMKPVKQGFLVKKIENFSIEDIPLIIGKVKKISSKKIEKEKKKAFLPKEFKN